MASFPQTGRDFRQKKGVLKGPEKGPCLVCSWKNKPANELGSDQHMRSGRLGFAGNVKTLAFTLRKMGVLEHFEEGQI